MNYELAKKLKDAGFPLDRGKGNSEFIIDEPKDAYWLYKPTLSELIEACIQHDPKKSFGLGFKQVGLRGHRSQDWWATNHQGEMGEGGSPEEAVACLWLMMNKK